MKIIRLSNPYSCVNYLKVKDERSFPREKDDSDELVNGCGKKEIISTLKHGRHQRWNSSCVCSHFQNSGKTCCFVSSSFVLYPAYVYELVKWTHETFVFTAHKLCNLRANFRVNAALQTFHRSSRGSFVFAFLRFSPSPRHFSTLLNRRWYCI